MKQVINAYFDWIRKSKTNTGFTLVEVILAMFIFALLAAGAIGFAIYYFQSYNFSYEENQAIGVAQSTITTMIREIREARPGEDGAWPLVQLDDTTFSFYADITNDGKTDKIRYFIDGSQLKKSIIEPSGVPFSYPVASEKISVVADYINNQGIPVFGYYNGDYPGDTINNPLSINSRLLNTRYVTVYLKVNINAQTGAQPFELSSGVQIRSLKDNL